MKREIAFFVYPGFQMLDLSGPLAAFHIAGAVTADAAYGLDVISTTGGLISASCGVEVKTRSPRNVPYDTVIVVGSGPPGAPCEPAPALTEAFTKSVHAVRRKASVCTGAFLLAAAGQLDGRNATTHWKYAATLQKLYPLVRVDADKIFIKDDDIWTSAGISAGIDLALAMIEEDLGVAASRAIAQTMVVYHRRPGGQTQFSALLEMDPDSDRIRKVLSHMREHLTEKLPVDRLAEIACVSPRQFGRIFLSETGETPAKAVERIRVEVARPRVEGSSQPIEMIARDVGFSNPERMRRAFLRIFGQPPQSMRRLACHRL